MEAGFSLYYSVLVMFCYLGRPVSHFLHLVLVFDKFGIQLSDLYFDSVHTKVRLWRRIPKKRMVQQGQRISTSCAYMALILMERCHDVIPSSCSPYRCDGIREIWLGCLLACAKESMHGECVSGWFPVVVDEKKKKKSTLPSWQAPGQARSGM